MLETGLSHGERGTVRNAEDRAQPMAINQQGKHPLTAAGLIVEAVGRRLIDDIDFSMSSGGVTVLMGFNGAGKSLLMRILHGMIVPDYGAVSWHGARLTDEVRRKQAAVFQKPVLLRRTVLANIEFALSSRGLKNIDMCQQILANAGLKSLENTPARLLSGGEQQRLALARALALEPEILFLDEATASLDPASTIAIEKMIDAACTSGIKVVMITHDIGQAKRLADEIVFVHEGKILETTTARQFFAKPRSNAACAYLEGRLPSTI